MRKEQESSVIYLDGAKVRRLRGRIIEENDQFVTIQRMDGTFTIAMGNVQRIERQGGACPHSFRHYDPRTNLWRCDRCGAEVSGDSP